MQQTPLDLLYEALATEFGIEVLASDPELLRQRLYKTRADSQDEVLKNLSITVQGDRIWIVKRKPSDAA